MNLPISSKKTFKNWSGRCGADGGNKIFTRIYSDDQHEKRTTCVYNLGIAHAPIGAIPYDILIRVTGYDDI